MENAVEAFIIVGRNATREVRELEVMSKDGMIFVDLFTNKFFEAGSSAYENGTFVKEESYTKRDHLLLEHKNFYDSILMKSPAVITLKDGLNAVHLVDRTLEALKTKSNVLVNLG